MARRGFRRAPGWSNKFYKRRRGSVERERINKQNCGEAESAFLELLISGSGTVVSSLAPLAAKAESLGASPFHQLSNYSFVALLGKEGFRSDACFRQSDNLVLRGRSDGMR